jgi:ketosteroid isomerase-like protein
MYKFCSRVISGFIAIILSTTVLVNAAYCRTNQEEKKLVEEAVTQFYIALNDVFKGNLEPMTKVWSHRDDIVYMGPTGSMQVGWKSVLANWKIQADMKLGGKVTPRAQHVMLGDDIAVIFDDEEGENLGKDGKLLKVNIRSTNVFQKENGQWKMVGHHTDKLAYLEGK